MPDPTPGRTPEEFSKETSNNQEMIDTHVDRDWVRNLETGIQLIERQACEDEIQIAPEDTEMERVVKEVFLEWQKRCQEAMAELGLNLDAKLLPPAQFAKNVLSFFRNLEIRKHHVSVFMHPHADDKPDLTLMMIRRLFETFNVVQDAKTILPINVPIADDETDDIEEPIFKALQKRGQAEKDYMPGDHYATEGLRPLFLIENFHRLGRQNPSKTVNSYAQMRELALNSDALYIVSEPAGVYPIFLSGAMRGQSTTFQIYGLPETTTNPSEIPNVWSFNAQLAERILLGGSHEVSQQLIGLPPEKAKVEVEIPYLPQLTPILKKTISCFANLPDSLTREQVHRTLAVRYKNANLEDWRAQGVALKLMQILLETGLVRSLAHDWRHREEEGEDRYYISNDFAKKYWSTRGGGEIFLEPGMLIEGRDILDKDSLYIP